MLDEKREMTAKYPLLAIAYAVMVVYASLFPCQGWHVPDESILVWLTLRLPDHVSKSDFLVNVIAYVPLGFLTMRLFWKKGGRSYLTPLLGMGLSFTMELLQTCLPSRTPSIVDLFTNTLGTIVGALVAVVWKFSTSSEGRLDRWRQQYLMPEARGELGVGIILCWALSQLAPFVPSFDLGGIKNALKPLWYTAHDLSLFKIADAVTYGCYLAALGVVAEASATRRSRPIPVFALFTAAVLLAKIFVLGRQLSLESLSGLLAALLLLSLMSLFPDDLRRYAGSALLLAGFAVYELKTGTGAPVISSFNWVPFKGQLAREISGFGTILEGIWPFAALSLLLTPRSGAGGGIHCWKGCVVLVFVFMLEWLQISIPGRTPDITQVILAGFGLVASGAYLRQKKSPEHPCKISEPYKERV